MTDWSNWSDCEEWDMIRLAIYELINTNRECAAYRTPDGTIFVRREDVLEEKFDVHGESDLDMEDWTSEEKHSAMKISCLDCPVFYDCPVIDDFVEDFVDQYGEPETVGDVLKAKRKKNKKNKKKSFERSPIEQSDVLAGTGLTLRADLCEINSPFWQTSFQVSGSFSNTTENKPEQDKDTQQRDDESYVIGCPFCGQHLEVPIELDNTTVNCPSCNKEVYLTKENAIEERGSKKKGTFRFECPFCQANLDVPDELDNTTANCPACNKEIHLTKKDTKS